MAIHVALHHVTTYHYDRPVMLGPHVVRLRPAPHCRTGILSYSLRIKPEKHFINWQQDPQSNYAARLVFPEPAREFRVEVDLVAEMAVYNPFDFFLEPEAEHVPFAYDPGLAHELAPFKDKGALTPKLEAYVAKARRELIEEPGKKAPVRTIDFIVAINQLLKNDISYLIRMEPGVQTPEETLTCGSGSCRDTSWLLCQVLRHLGMAARFVSGYLIQLKPDVQSLDGPSGAEVDFTDLHAWCEIYLPGAGWIGLDPTSGLLAGEGHIPLAATPDPQSAAAITGATDKCEVTFDFTMSVRRIKESPRVTNPCTEEQWAAIEALGELVDRELAAGDVRLTMGGEPTFVSIDDPDGDEWNNAATGPQKRILSGKLIHRLRHRFGPGALLHFGTGKWYPGEQLPRWSLGCFWRKDGVPVWKDDTLIADESVDYGHTVEDAEKLMKEIVRLLTVNDAHVIPAYEDVYYLLWRERKLPSNVDPLKSNLKDELERKRLRRLFERGLDKKTGWVLPLRKYDGTWRSGGWFLRDETLYLIPGDSPMGLRLPLDSLPWVAENEYPWVHPPDPMTPLFQLPSLPAAPGKYGSTFGRPVVPSLTAPTPLDRKPDLHESASWTIRQALCVEPREGRLHVFMPPAENAAEYLELVAIVEEAARLTAFPVIVEGETPPYDPRLRVLKVTPDPGVIEVNMHPAYSWRELSENTQALYEEARLSRLGTEKFMLDGRHTGTGGGNHIVMGGETPSDSPLLRRPDLLRSLLGFWHNHPSLSYLFSGLFIGPTSQHPRVDEARNDALYELELAFSQVPNKGPTPPWLSDRVFRHLLTDVTGNMHRTEFCIDKLFSPDASGSRLGLVELRSFEMPPHSRMSLAQYLLLRASIARFWKTPYYPKEMARWGTELHDRWLLPHFVREDFADVLASFKESGYAFDPAWFEPHIEFRFPLIGTVTKRGVSMELRSALEPWPVLGEEAGGGGTVRYVDSSLERLQVKVSGLTDTRHIVLCNGRRVPLHPTGVAGEYVAGVRYRAWQPPSCLQPAIAPHVPIVVDLYDTWNGRSIGGGTYHVSHPGGRSHDTFPVNAYEAESRRLARFSPHGHTPGLTVPKDTPINREYPMTLDLRRPA
jgi:uncharacterized protein (DUF2126 family)/transglutaminase-like putative cysteine protease